MYCQKLFQAEEDTNLQVDKSNDFQQLHGSRAQLCKYGIIKFSKCNNRYLHER